MKIIFNIIYFITVVIVPVIIFEFYDHYFSKTEMKFDTTKLWEGYTIEELDLNLSSFHPRSGKNCMQKITPTWHHKIGFQDKKINFECLKKHFTKNTFNIAFFGGSVMENTYYKNYLTSIDWQIIKDNKNIHSINFAQSGSRLSNEFASFVIMLKHTKPDLAVFLDGANEFNSIKYNDGEPEEDFYWSVWAKKKFDNPIKIYLDKIIEKSATARVVLIKLFGYKPSNHIQNKQINKNTILEAANDYLHYKKIIENICEANAINCLFFLQPMIYTTIIDDEITSKLKSKFAKFYPNNNDIYNIGYEKILEKENVIDLSDALSNIKYAFLDEMHVNKNGSFIISKEMKKKINEQINQN